MREPRSKPAFKGLETDSIQVTARSVSSGPVGGLRPAPLHREQEGRGLGKAGVATSASRVKRGAGDPTPKRRRSVTSVDDSPAG